MAGEDSTERRWGREGRRAGSLVAEASISHDRWYRVSLAPGTYVVDIARNGMDRADGLRKTIVIKNRKTVQLNIDIDTGIR